MLPALLGVAAKYLLPEVPGLIGSLLGDKTGEAVQEAIGVVSEIVGTSDPADAESALSANPELLARLRERMLEVKDRADERAHQQEMERMRLVGQVIAGAITDRQSARDRDREFIKAGKVNTRANWMIGLAVAGVIACVLALVFGKVDGNTAVGGFIISVGTLLAGKIGTAFDFEFGGSATEKETRAMLAKGGGQPPAGDFR